MSRTPWSSLTMVGRVRRRSGVMATDPGGARRPAGTGLGRFALYAPSPVAGVTPVPASRSGSPDAGDTWLAGRSRARPAPTARPFAEASISPTNTRRAYSGALRRLDAVIAVSAAGARWPCASAGCACTPAPASGSDGADGPVSRRRARGGLRIRSRLRPSETASVAAVARPEPKRSQLAGVEEGAGDPYADGGRRALGRVGLPVHGELSEEGALPSIRRRVRGRPECRPGIAADHAVAALGVRIPRGEPPAGAPT